MFLVYCLDMFMPVPDMFVNNGALTSPEETCKNIEIAKTQAKTKKNKKTKKQTKQINYLSFTISFTREFVFFVFLVCLCTGITL